ncbi:DUF1631 family protein [Dyella flagellata]
MPLRARKLIEAACMLCDHWAEPTLRLCLDRFDKRLYERAEQSRNHFDQQQCFDSRHLLRKGRTAFIESFAARLRESFERMSPQEDEQAASGALNLHSLTLLDRTEHELTAALDTLAARAEAQNGPILSELSYRLAVLVGAPPLEGTQLPPGPQNMARILRAASEPLNLPIEHRLLLLQEFDGSVGRTLVSLYEGINAKLLEEGILPRLRAFAITRIAHGPTHAGSQSIGAGPAAAPTNTAKQRHGSEPIAVLETLRDMLTRQRMPASGMTPAAADRTATPEELQTALSALQQHMVQVTDRTSRELRSAQRLQEELLYQLNLGLPPGAAPMQLTAEQGDTVELVAMLFEQLVQQLHHGPDAHALLGNLQLPLLRMAVADRDFFNLSEHPARQLLGKLADAIDTWLQGPNGETDQHLLAKLSQLVDRAQQEPPTAGLYTTLLADIDHHLTQLMRKAQTAERRHVEAMQGRERLEQARRRAGELMAERFAVVSPRGLLRTLLERAWTDVLALSLLRHEEHSEAFLHQLCITDQLLGQFPIQDPLALRQEVENGLQQIGMPADEAEQVAQRLISAQMPASIAPSPPPAEIAEAVTAEAALDEKSEPAAPPMATPALEEAKPQPPPSRLVDAPSATDLAIRLKQRQRLGEQRNQEASPATQAAVVPPLGLREARIFNHLRQLPFGTWFEFTDPAGGAAAQQKLAWFSPISGNSLFVNRRGQRSDVMNLQELARAIAEGRVRELPPQEDNLLDRAWHALTSNLRRPAPLLPETHS